MFQPQYDDYDVISVELEWIRYILNFKKGQFFLGGIPVNPWRQVLGDLGVGLAELRNWKFNGTLW